MSGPRERMEPPRHMKTEMWRTAPEAEATNLFLGPQTGRDAGKSLEERVARAEEKEVANLPHGLALTANTSPM